MFFFLFVPGDAGHKDFFFLIARHPGCLHWVQAENNEELMEEFGVVGGMDPEDGQVRVGKVTFCFTTLSDRWK